MSSSKYYKNSLLLISLQIYKLLLGFFVGIAVARYLSPEGFGEYATILSIFTIVKVLSSGGMEQIVIKNIVENPNNVNGIVETYNSLRLILAGASLTLLFVYIAMFSSSSAHAIIVMSCALLISGSDHIELTSQANGSSKKVSRYIILAQTLSAFIKLLLIKAQAPLESFIYTLAFDAWLLYGLYVLANKQINNKAFALGWHSHLVKSIISNSWPVLLSSGSVIIYMKIDQLMIYEMLGAKEVGIYAATTRVAELAYFIPTAFMAGLYPLLVKTSPYKQNYIRTSAQLFSLLLWSSIILIIIMTLIASSLMSFLFGNDYSSGIPVLQIHIMACCPVFVGVLFRKMAIIENAAKITMWVTVSGCIINIFLNYIAIQAAGLEGAAWATVVSRLLASIILYFLFSQTRFLLFVLLQGLSPRGAIEISKSLLRT